MTAKPDLIVRSPYIDARSRAVMAERYNAHFLPTEPDPEAVLARHGPGLRVLVTDGHTGADAALMDRLPRLELIACYGVGYDGIDVAAARARGIAVTHTPDVLTDEVANFTVGLLVASGRQFLQADRFVREGRWTAGSYPLTRTIIGKTIGILGLGRIGRAIAARCTVMGANIVYGGRRPHPDSGYEYVADPVELARRSDFLVVSCALEPATHRLVGEAMLAALGADGILVNIARGPVVDEQALIRALQTGAIAGAALDVFDQEPVVPAELTALPNVLLMPHMASGTAETRQAIGQLVLDNLAAFFEGRPLPTPVP